MEIVFLNMLILEVYLYIHKIFVYTQLELHHYLKVFSIQQASKLVDHF